LFRIASQKSFWLTKFESFSHFLFCAVISILLIDATHAILFNSTRESDLHQTTSTALPQHPQNQNGLSDRIFQLFNKASTIFHIFALSQMDCASQNGRGFKKNLLKKTTRGNHWGDIRAKLEVDIQEILAILKVIETTVEDENQLKNDVETEIDTENDDDVFIEEKARIKRCVRKPNRYRSTSSSSSIMLPSSYTLNLSSKSDEVKSLNIELITLVRKKFAVTLQKLMQHGLRSVNETRHLVPFIGCFYNNFQLNHERHEYPEEDYKVMHAWELILEYYRLKNGDYYTETPAQKLSQSFNLDIVGDGLASNKQVRSIKFFYVFKII
jgi:RUN domain-containing protein 1